MSVITRNRIGLDITDFNHDYLYNFVKKHYKTISEVSEYSDWMIYILSDSQFGFDINTRYGPDPNALKKKTLQMITDIIMLETHYPFFWTISDNNRTYIINGKNTRFLDLHVNAENNITPELLVEDIASQLDRYAQELGLPDADSYTVTSEQEPIEYFDVMINNDDNTKSSDAIDNISTQPVLSANAPVSNDFEINENIPIDTKRPVEPLSEHNRITLFEMLQLIPKDQQISLYAEAHIITAQKQQLLDLNNYPSIYYYMREIITSVSYNNSCIRIEIKSS